MYIFNPFDISYFFNLFFWLTLFTVFFTTAVRSLSLIPLARLHLVISMCNVQNEKWNLYLLATHNKNRRGGGRRNLSCLMKSERLSYLGEGRHPLVALYRVVSTGARAQPESERKDETSIHLRTE